MTSFPAISEGKIGAFDFTHLTRIFRAVEEFERIRPFIVTAGDVDIDNASEVEHESALWAILGDSQTVPEDDELVEYEWDSAQITDTTFAPIPNGESSTVGGDSFANAAIVLPGNIARVYAFRDTTGAVRYFVSRPTGQAFGVKVTSDGGDAGGSGSSASWTYTVTDDDNTELGTGLSPTINFRPPIGKMLAAPDGSRGLAMYAASGALELLIVGEKASTETC